MKQCGCLRQKTSLVINCPKYLCYKLRENIVWFTTLFVGNLIFNVLIHPRKVVDSQIIPEIQIRSLGPVKSQRTDC